MFLQRAYVGDVSGPPGVRLAGLEVAPQMVNHVNRARITGLAAPVLALRNTPQAVRLHQPADAVDAGRLAFLAQIFMYPAAAQNSVTGRIQDADPAQ